MKKKLNRLNFDGVLWLSKEIVDIDTYSFRDYEREGYEHPVVGMCLDCEKKGFSRCLEYDETLSMWKECRTCEVKEELMLMNISHGSHTCDFLEASNEVILTEGWNEKGVMFVAESPSINYHGLYASGIPKNPAIQWYWIHNRKDIKEYPGNFKGGIYGDFFASAIKTFKLKNAYVTNLVKCGLNNMDGTKYRGIGCYNKNCISNCFSNYLIKEIEIVDPKVIFTMGSKTYNQLRTLINESELKDKNIRIEGLPHPAGQRRGLKDIYFETLYFNLILKALYQTQVIPAESIGYYSDLYLNV